MHIGETNLIAFKDTIDDRSNKRNKKETHQHT